MSSFDFQNVFLDRFVRYAKIGTGSDSTTGKSPSTQAQFQLAYLLKSELEALGFRAEVSEYCYVYALFNKGASRRICLLAHMDTSEDAQNQIVNPYVHVFKGEDIELANGVVLSASELAQQNCAHGDVLVSSDGSSLLGGDDKAGIAVIMTLLEYLGTIDCSALPEIAICFTPDEEIGEGVKNIDIKRLNSESTLFALTIDGSNFHELSFETFSAKAFKIAVSGYNTHPGDAYGKMINATLEACALAQKIAEAFRPPENSHEHENYVLVNDIHGEVGECTIQGIIRSFDDNDIDYMHARLVTLVQEFQKSSRAYLEVEVREQYRNLKYSLSDAVVSLLLKCGEQFNCRSVPIRGGTDGNKLSAMGLQTPNVWNGSFWYHSVREVVNTSESVAAVQFLLHVLRSV